MPKLTSILEYASITPETRVDRAAGVIHGVKLLGRSSVNAHGIKDRDGRLVEGTDYSPEAIRQFVEQTKTGLFANVDHPPRADAGKVRSSYDRIGKYLNIHEQDGEPYGDLHLLKSHAMAGPIMDAAEKPELNDCFAVSQNAMAQGEVRGRRWVVTQIARILGGDVVTDGGTNVSLFESREHRPMKTLKKLFEIRPTLAKSFTRLLEDDEMAAMEVGDDDPGWKEHLVKAIGKLVEGDDAECHAMAKKIMKLLEPAGEEEEVEEEDETPEEPEKKEKEKMEEAVKESKQLKRTNKALTLLLESGIKASPIQVKAVASLDTDAEMKDLIGTFGAGGKPGATRPRSQSPTRTATATTVQESANGKTEADEDEALLASLWN